jgi:hypothetical protein
LVTDKNYSDEDGFGKVKRSEIQRDCGHLWRSRLLDSQ